MRTINQAGLAILKRWERSLRKGSTPENPLPALEAYRCPSGVWTIGWGHTGRMHPPIVKKGDTVTPTGADDLLSLDLSVCEKAINAALPGDSLNENEFSALACFVFNVGVDQFLGSTLLRRARAWDKLGTAEQFRRWIKGTTPEGKKVIMPGLIPRREEERELFLRRP